MRLRLFQLDRSAYISIKKRNKKKCKLLFSTKCIKETSSKNKNRYTINLCNELFNLSLPIGGLKYLFGHIAMTKDVAEIYGIFTR